MDLERNVKRTQPDFYAAIEVDSVRVMTLPYGQSALVVPQNCKINLGQMKEDDKCNTSSSSHYKLIIHASVDRAPHKSQFEPLPLLLYKPSLPPSSFSLHFSVSPPESGLLQIPYGFSFHNHHLRPSGHHSDPYPHPSRRSHSRRRWCRLLTATCARHCRQALEGHMHLHLAFAK